eukprot:15341683-Ditylum_brightwellii.AAC.1
MREKLRTVTAYDMFSDKEDVIELLKENKSTFFKFDNNCDIYIAWWNIVNSSRGTQHQPRSTARTAKQRSSKSHITNRQCNENNKRNFWENASTMIRERHDHSTSKVDTEPQLAFHADEEVDQDDSKEVIPPTGGGRV